MYGGMQQINFKFYKLFNEKDTYLHQPKSLKDNRPTKSFIIHA